MSKPDPIESKKKSKKKKGMRYQFTTDTYQSPWYSFDYKNQRWMPEHSDFTIFGGAQ